MIIKIPDDYLAALYQGKRLTGKPRFGHETVNGFIKTVNKLKNAESLKDIKAQRSLNFEGLKGKFKGKFSVRVDQKYRLILRIEKEEVVLVDVIVIEELSNHYQ